MIKGHAGGSLQVKVLHVIPSLARVHGGPTRALSLMEKSLGAKDVTVETVTTDDDGWHRRNGRPSGVPLTENGVRRRYFPKCFEFYKISPSLAWWLFRHVRNYDLVHIHALFSFSSLVAAWAAHRAGVPYVLRPLGTLTRYGITQRRPWLKRLSLTWLEGPALRRAAAVHFTSEDEMREAAEISIPMNGVVIPLGIEPFLPANVAFVRAAFPALGNSRYLLYLSRLDPKKNLEGLLRAYRQFSDNWSDVKLLVAGDGATEYVASLKALSSELGLGDNVVWAGNIEGDLKSSALSGAQLFVLPSFSENFGIAAAEALMAGLPCVLGQGVAIAQDVMNAGAGVTVAPDQASIAEGLMQVMADAQVRATMSARAVFLAQGKFSAKAMGANLVALYNNIIVRPQADFENGKECEMSFLNQISVLILTFNEEPNIERTLDALTAFPEVLVLDSGSTDKTLAIAARFSNVRVCQRPFDNHSAQWNHGLTACGLKREWVLALDADYVLSSSLVKEIAVLKPPVDVAGYCTSFTYWVLGKPLTRSLYPPVTTLYRRSGAHYEQDGHTQRVKTNGNILGLEGRIAHDDRKPLSNWLAAQDRYARLECDLLLSKEWAALTWRDRLRRMKFITPWLVPLYCLTIGRGLLDGRAGWYYAVQRGMAESILSAVIIEKS